MLPSSALIHHLELQVVEKEPAFLFLLLKRWPKIWAWAKGCPKSVGAAAEAEVLEKKDVGLAKRNK